MDTSKPRHTCQGMGRGMREAMEAYDRETADQIADALGMTEEERAESDALLPELLAMDYPERYGVCDECGGSFEKDHPNDTICGDCEPGDEEDAMLGYSVDDWIEAQEAEERRKAARRQAESVEGAVEVVATANVWSHVWDELFAQDEDGVEGAGDLLQMLVDRTPPGVEDLGVSEEQTYAVWLTPEEREDVELWTGIKLG
ncbi:MAG: hypothetical protein M3Q10_00660 [Chloroflexota bacterium]|nr:hypothetical protein [Chloroflexota bacterium]